MSSKTMAKRAAAGTLALAVCLTGGAVAFAGAANAAGTSSPHGQVRVAPSQAPVVDDTATTVDEGLHKGYQNVPTIIAGKTSDVSNFQIVLPNTWSKGDSLIVTLPTGYTFGAVPTVISNDAPTTSAMLETKVQGNAVTDTSAVKPALSASFVTTTNASGVSVASQSSFAITLGNDAEGTGSGSTVADTDPVWVLNVTGVKVATPSKLAATDTVTATITDSAADGTSKATFDGSTVGASGAVTTLAFATSFSASVAATTLVPGSDDTSLKSEEQLIGDVTLTEASAAAFKEAGGQYQIALTDQNGKALELGSPTGEGTSFDAKFSVNGTEVTPTSGSITATGGVLSFSFPSGVMKDIKNGETVTVSKLRVKPAKGSTSVRVSVTKFAGVVVNFSAENGDATTNDLSRVETNNGDLPAASETAGVIGVVPQNSRIGGNDRYETAALVAQQAFPYDAAATAPRATSVVIASGEAAGGGVDALAANYLAGVLEAPVLLTKSSKLPDATLVAIRNLLETPGANAVNSAANVYVVGGNNAVNESVLTELRNAFASDFTNLTVQRVAGDDRYETAAVVSTNRGTSKVGTYTATFGAGAAKTAILVNGARSADALAAGPIAFDKNFPLLLTGMDSVPAATMTALDSLAIKHVVVVGGTAVVSTSVETQLQAAGIAITRVAGADRYETTTKLYELAHKTAAPTSSDSTGGFGWEDTPNAETYLANGVGFADALVAGSLAGGERTPLLLTDPAKLSDATSAYIVKNKANVGQVTGIGLSAALPQAVLQEANRQAQ